MKDNKRFLVIGALFIGYLLFTKKANSQPVDTPVDPVPPILPPGQLTIYEKTDALRYYSDQKGLNWSAKLAQMATNEIETLYTYIFEYLLPGVRTPNAALFQRINLIKLKYQIKV